MPDTRRENKEQRCIESNSFALNCAALTRSFNMIHAQSRFQYRNQLHWSINENASIYAIATNAANFCVWFPQHIRPPMPSQRLFCLTSITEYDIFPYCGPDKFSPTSAYTLELYIDRFGPSRSTTRVSSIRFRMLVNYMYVNPPSPSGSADGDYVSLATDSKLSCGQNYANGPMISRLY